MSEPVELAVIVPVYRNAATLPALHARLSTALEGETWALRLVIDACPAGSDAVADDLAARDPRVTVTRLARNGGQHAALVAGLHAEAQASAWVVLDADLQDPPEAVPQLLRELRRGHADCVFAGRRGRYESVARRASGGLHRRLLRRLTGLPVDAGAFAAFDARLRRAVLRSWDEGAPSVVAAIATAGLPLTSLPVERDRRPEGRSSWTSRARVEQGVRSLRWAVRHRNNGVRSA